MSSVKVLAGVVAEADADAWLRDALDRALEANQRWERLARELREENAIRPDLIIPTGKRKGQNPSLASIYRALAGHEKAAAYPDAVAQAHAEFAEQHAAEATAGIVRPRPARVLDPVNGLKYRGAD